MCPQITARISPACVRSQVKSSQFKSLQLSLHKAVGQIDFHTFALFAVSPLLRSPSAALSPSPALSVAQLMIDSYLAFYQCAGARSLSHTVQRVISLSLSLALLVLTRFSHIIREVVAEAV